MSVIAGTEQRAAAVRSAIEDIRETLAIAGIDRVSLARALRVLQALAGRSELWNGSDFPDPVPPEPHVRYLIREDADRGYALYLNVIAPGRLIPPHNHDTWACVAAVEGTEYNVLYRRTDDGARAGYATIEEIETVQVRPGTGLAMMPENIHSVTVKGSEPIRHLHLYGRALETMTTRLSYDPATNSCKLMVLGVATRR
jgi:predicted metal-dependent enzyme (double-stranded beta helix superfamily)